MSSDLDAVAALEGNGLGSLADELADAWDDEDEDEDEDEEERAQSPARESLVHDAVSGQARDSGIDVASSPMQKEAQHGVSSPTHGPGRASHRRTRSRYDGSDYGDESDGESTGMSSALEARRAAIEGLARRGLENSGTATDDVVERVIRSLKDLGPQSSLENGATR